MGKHPAIQPVASTCHQERVSYVAPERRRLEREGVGLPSTDATVVPRRKKRALRARPSLGGCQVPPRPRQRVKILRLYAGRRRLSMGKLPGSLWLVVRTGKVLKAVRRWPGMVGWRRRDREVQGRQIWCGLVQRLRKK